MLLFVWLLHYSSRIFSILAPGSHVFLHLRQLNIAIVGSMWAFRFDIILQLGFSSCRSCPCSWYLLDRQTGRHREVFGARHPPSTCGLGGYEHPKLLIFGLTFFFCISKLGHLPNVPEGVLVSSLAISGLDVLHVSWCGSNH